MSLSEIARAKVNLTLRVLGRRPDAYHELESLVAFADVGDRLTMDPARPPACTVVGPFADALAGAANLVDEALARIMTIAPRIRLGHVTLDKRLPVAAGLGGGSADAAAVLRLAARANPEQFGEDQWIALAAGLGADVPVCFVDQPAVMTGIGARVTAIPDLPPLFALLVNPLVSTPPNKTAAVFRRLAAPALVHPADHAAAVTRWRTPRSTAAMLDALAANANDLEAPAAAEMPAVRDVLLLLHTLPDVRVVRLSGAGPTCFALFERADQADLARRLVAERRPSWWTSATVLR
jgi:4-diphosphocytidyl-2-C-methyl-D-erythritol kinase